MYLAAANQKMATPIGNGFAPAPEKATSSAMGESMRFSELLQQQTAAFALAARAVPTGARPSIAKVMSAAGIPIFRTDGGKDPGASGNETRISDGSEVASDPDLGRLDREGSGATTNAPEMLPVRAGTASLSPAAQKVGEKAEDAPAHATRAAIEAPSGRPATAAKPVHPESLIQGMPKSALYVAPGTADSSTSGGGVGNPVAKAKNSVGSQPAIPAATWSATQQPRADTSAMIAAGAPHPIETRSSTVPEGSAQRQAAQEVQRPALRVPDSSGKPLDRTAMHAANASEKPETGTTDALRGKQTDSEAESQPVASSHAPKTARATDAAVPVAGAIHAAGLGTGQATTSGPAPVQASPASLATLSATAPALRAAAPTLTAHAANSATGSPFARMDSASAPQVLESAPQRLSVGVRDSGLGWVEVRTHAAGGHVSAVLRAAEGEARATLAAHLPEVREFLATQQVRVDWLSSETLPPGAGDRQGKRDGEQTQAQTGPREEPAQENDEAFFAAPVGDETLSYINVRA